MNSAAAPDRPRKEAGADDTVAARLCADVFTSLARSDQRARARQYVQGLLTTEGRKSFRNMAAQLGGGPTLEQRMHHFVSCSTWDWVPVRQALTEVMAQAAPPEAWVLRPLLVPKDGSETVGVHQRHDPALGRLLNLQYTVGLWSASAAAAHPLGWRLLLPRVWTDDPVRRARVSIPASRRAETPGECAVEACLETVARAPRTGPPRPVVVAVDGADVVGVIQQLRAARLPFLVKSDRAVPLAVVDQDTPGAASRPHSPHQIIAAARSRPRPGGAQAPADDRTLAVRVRSPLRGTRSEHTPDDDLLLVGSADAGHPPGDLWLTNMRDTPVARLTALTALVARSDDALARTTVPLGIKDFTGRTFDGWNRHTTLVSVAHCAVLLSQAAHRPPPEA